MDCLADLGTGLPIVIGIAVFAIAAGASVGYSKYKEFREYMSLERYIEGRYDERNRRDI